MKEIAKLNFAMLYHHSIEKVYPDYIEEQHTTLSNIKLYPNPANNQTNILFNINKTTEISISLTDMMGKEILQIPAQTFLNGNHNVLINCQNFSAGMYFCTLISNGNTETIPLIIKK